MVACSIWRGVEKGCTSNATGTLAPRMPCAGGKGGASASSPVMELPAAPGGGELGGVSWPQVCCYLDWHGAAPWTLRVTGSQTSLVSSGASSLSTQLPFSCLKPSLQLVRFFDSSQGLYGQRLQF